MQRGDTGLCGLHAKYRNMADGVFLTQSPSRPSPLTVGRARTSISTERTPCPPFSPACLAQLASGKPLAGWQVTAIHAVTKHFYHEVRMHHDHEEDIFFPYLGEQRECKSASLPVRRPPGVGARPIDRVRASTPGFIAVLKLMPHVTIRLAPMPIRRGRALMSPDLTKRGLLSWVAPQRRRSRCRPR